MRLDRLLKKFPDARSVFEAHGLGQLVTEESLKAVGPFLTLETALVSRGVAVNTFMQLLNESCRSETPLDAPGLAHASRQGDIHLLALMPCGLKVPFGKALATFINDLGPLDGKPVNYSVESNLNFESSYYPCASHIDNLDELPDILVSADFNPFFHHRFYRRFIQPGHFVDTMAYTPNRLFTEAGIIDPHRQYSIIGVNPLIVVADLQAVGDRPLPRCWADLLNPMWRGSITLRGNDRFFCHAVLLPLFKEYGPAGMRALGANVHDGRHASQMVKTAGSGRSAALYVMPDFFARKISADRAVQLIWPEDGALASPVTLLVKREKAGRLKPIIEYLTGEDLAQVFVGAYFASPHPFVQNRLPDYAGLKWLGWNFIHDNDLAAVNAEIDRVFQPAVFQGGRS
jgi:ABC-type Fe3+ transport system substrate-binding protein